MLATVNKVINMIKKVAITLLIIPVLLLSSCSLGETYKFTDSFDNDQEFAISLIDKVLETIQNKDCDSLKSLFSKNAISESKNFAQSVTDLFDFYEGDFISYNDWGGPEVFTEREDGQIIKQMNSTYDVETSKEKYRIAIQNVVDDTTNSDNVGIRSFYIINAENDTDLQFAYRGDGEYTPGINFNIKNSIPKDE